MKVLLHLPINKKNNAIKIYLNVRFYNKNLTKTFIPFSNFNSFSLTLIIIHLNIRFYNKSLTKTFIPSSIFNSFSLKKCNKFRPEYKHDAIKHPYSCLFNYSTSLFKWFFFLFLFTCFIYSILKTSFPNWHQISTEAFCENETTTYIPFFQL